MMQNKRLEQVINLKSKVAIFLISVVVLLSLVGCENDSKQSDAKTADDTYRVIVNVAKNSMLMIINNINNDALVNAENQQSVEAKLQNLNLTKDIRASFNHGSKGSEFQKYIVLHDTEGEGSASGVVDWWDSNGAGVAAHFVINKDGSIVQCVDLDRITHHAGYGDTGHNQKYGTTDESRDDKIGTQSIGSWASDYGMNSYSVGIEMVHVGGSGDYPKEQLEALDNLIAYIDAYYGFESEIIDHKAWRSGNSDTSPEFAQYLANYQDHRSYK